MRHTLLAAAAALLAASGAHAAAWIDGTYAGKSAAQTISGFTYSEFFFGIDLAPGQSYTQSFTYDLTLHNDGLQFPFEEIQPQGIECSPFGAQCTPAFDGREQVEFHFDVNHSQYGSGQFAYSVTGAPRSVSVAPGQTVRLRGTVLLTETNVETNAFMPDLWDSSSALQIYTSEWVSTTTLVDEPPVGAMMLAAALALGSACRRRVNGW